MSDAQIQQVLQQMRTLAAKAQGGSVEVENDTGNKFKNLFQSAIDNVNDIQKQSGKLQDAFIKGEDNVSLPEVMIASQKAGVAFQAVVQVRNKLIKAYEDIMNMPI